MIPRPPRSTLSSSSAASDVYKRQIGGLMQFSDEFNTLYKDVIRPICKGYGYKVVRGDDFYTSGQIMVDVTQSIRSAALIIADVTPRNENVFYELGFAHAIGKPTILLSDRKRERLPFDIAGLSLIHI